MRALLLLVLIPCQLATAAELVDRIAAIVGEEIITLSDVKSFRKGSSKDPMEALIRQKLFEQEVRRFDIQVTDDDLAGGIAEVLARNRMTLPELKRELQKEGKSFDQYKEELKGEIRRMKFLGQVIVPRIQIPEEEISGRLGKNPTDEDRMRARQEIVQSKIPDELDRYLDEVRKKTYVEIKK